MQLEIMNEKEILEQKIYLEINSPIKKEGQKINIKGMKKFNSDSFLVEKKKDNDIIDEKDKSYFKVKKIFWDYKKMLGNLKFCNIPRFLIVEVKNFLFFYFILFRMKIKEDLIYLRN